MTRQRLCRISRPQRRLNEPLRMHLMISKTGDRSPHPIPLPCFSPCPSVCSVAYILFRSDPSLAIASSIVFICLQYANRTSFFPSSGLS